MKNLNIIASFIVVFCCFSLCNVYAQRTNTWIGGSPGHETDWNYYKNWSLNDVPDWTDDVIIPDVSSSTHHYPVIKEIEAEINSLTINPKANLHVTAKASLVVLSEESYNHGILNQGALVIDGILEYGDNLLSHITLLEEETVVAAPGRLKY